MGGWIVECDGKMVTMPIDGDWIVSTLEGRFPNGVMLRMDEDRFTSAFAHYAVWTTGDGNYATLSSYCGCELTIIRHITLENAIKAKRGIDSYGCGGACAKIHVIVEIDPLNSRKARERDNVRKHLAGR